MSASVHNFILTYNELNIITGLLRDSYDNTTDDNSKNSTMALLDKIKEQRDSGYPAKDYPFWRNYFEEENEPYQECERCLGNIYVCGGKECIPFEVINDCKDLWK